MKVIDFLEEYKSEIGVSPDSCDAISLINKARELLYPLGEFVGTMGYGTITLTDNKCAYLPYDIETLKRAFTGCKNIVIEDSGYCSMADEFCQCGCSSTDLTAIKTGTFSPLPFDTLNNRAYYFRNISKLDNGKKINISYVDSSGTERTEEVILDRDKPVNLCHPMNHVLSLHKDRTLGIVGLYINPSSGSGKAVLIHRIYPKETYPMYAKYSFAGCFCECIVLYGKKRFIGYTNDDYGMEMQLDINPHALVLGIKAIQNLSGAKEDLNFYAQYVKLAKEFLKQEKNDKTTSFSGTRKVQWDVELPTGTK